MDILLKRKFITLGLLIFTLQAHATLVTTNRTAFESQLAGGFFVDDFETGYEHGDLVDAADHDYFSTGTFNDVKNEVNYFAGDIHPSVFDQADGNRYFCTGCNDWIILVFTDTSYGTTDGVFGAGLDLILSDNVNAQVTFGDGTEQLFNIADGSSFWGITSTIAIKDITLGFGAMRLSMDSGLVAIDNMTIGALRVPEPATLALMGLGLVGLGFARRKKAA